MVQRLLILVLLTTGIGATAAPPSATGSDDLFADHVAPLLQARCLSCHNDAEAKGEFSLQTPQDLHDNGFVDVGDPDGSYLLELVEGDGSHRPEMPKDGEPLTGEQVMLLRDWIAGGANWPGDLRLEEPRVTDLDWWSLRPLGQPEVPRLNADAWQANHYPHWQNNPIDRFVMKRLSDEGIWPNVRADRSTLIRRIYYDLLGLPPSAAEVAQFVADPDPQAYDKLVDRLLASPHYGERWARHWLDVVHYGDTHGYDKDKLRPNAWPYRDYVIRSFNEDKPYSRFVHEQLAGDVLWPDTTDGIVATGFISAGPWDFIGHAEVSEEKIDGKVARNLDRDDMVTTTMNTFVSLTVQCARCHHHKLDPVSMEEYYRLQAVFAAMDRADRDFDADPQIARRRHRLNEAMTQLETELATVESQIDSRLTDEIRALDEEIARLRSAIDGKTSIDLSTRSAAYGFHSQVSTDSQEPKWVQIDLGYETNIDSVVMVAAQEWGWDDFGFPHRYRIEVSRDGIFDDAITIADQTQADVVRPGARPVVIDAGGTPARFVRVTATSLWNRRGKDAEQTSDWIFALGELFVISGDQMISGRRVEAKDSIEALPRWGKTNLVDGVLGPHSLDRWIGHKQGSPTNGYHSQFSDTADVEKWVQIDLGEVRDIDLIELVPAFPTDFADTPGFGFPIQFRVQISNDATFEEGIPVAYAKSDDAGVGDRRLVIPVTNGKARYVRVTATRLWDRGGKKHALALAELRVFQGAANVARGCDVSASDSIEAGRWSTRHLVDGYSSRIALDARADLVRQLAVPVASRESLDAATVERAAMEREAIGDALFDQRADLRRQIETQREALQQLPKPARVYAGTVHQGSGSFRGRAGLGPREIAVLRRGDVMRPAEVVGPGTVSLIPGVGSPFALGDEHHEGDRRVALARWITRRDNPLTWRSIVNRVWHYHFGRGIVDTPNDFGRGGSQPTHPELLDWLAVEFRDNGQSLKRLHRMICTSEVYKQRSHVDGGFEDKGDRRLVDADNRLLWRMNRRRLTAEEIRDTVLYTAGRLNDRMGGPGFQDFVIEHPEHSPHYEYYKHDPLDPDSHRRAVYRFIVRSQPQPFMTTLDCADPSISVPSRDETVTPLQALTMLNNQFMLAMAEELAARVERESVDLRDQVELAWLYCNGKSVDARLAEYLERYAEQHGLKNLCRILMNSNEPVFID